MNTTKNAKPADSAAPLWTGLRESDFDAAAPLTLFGLSAVDNSMSLRKPDRCGTPDLFSDWGMTGTGEASPVAETLNERGAIVVHAAIGEDPLCGWIADGETVTAEAGLVTCRDCLAAG